VVASCRVSAHHRSPIVSGGVCVARERVTSSRSSGATGPRGRRAPAAPHLRAVALRAVPPRAEGRFPFTVPAIRTLPALDMSARVTFFVGENGSGKSTLLEAIAVAASLPVIGSDDVDRDETLASQRVLARLLRLTWGNRTGRGFFLRAEDFFGFAKRLARERADLLQRLSELDEDYADRSSYAKGLAAGPVHSSLADMERRYGVNLDANSHGESFLTLFRARFAPGGLHLMDEPEAALSPQSQLALLAMIMDMVEADAQFIIASHSPILLAFPGARIYDFDAAPVAEAAYEELGHVALTRAFLREPERYVRELAAGGRTRDAETARGVKRGRPANAVPPRSNKES